MGLSKALSMEMPDMGNEINFIAHTAATDARYHTIREIITLIEQRQKEYVNPLYDETVEDIAYMVQPLLNVDRYFECEDILKMLRKL